jgi:integrase
MGQDYISIETIIPPEYPTISTSSQIQIQNKDTPKELLGHSKIEMTQRYVHLVNGALRKAVNFADEVFG